MSRIVRFLRALKNNPKKSIFFSGLGVVGFNFARGRYEDEQLMREYCKDALKFGEQIQYLSDKERHVTVILNPAANGGKSRTHFDRYCAPLLHLAGLKVAMVKTEHEGQARDYMKIMENTSAVIVGGGDGTLAEVVTGLMRREDQQTITRRLTLGLLPLGEKNNTASSIWGFQNTPKVKHLAEATMDIIRNIKRPLDIMEITPLTDTSDEPSKPVYAVSSIEWSAYRDAYERKDKYWYWPFIKQYMTYIFSSYKDLSWNCDVDLEYILPCSGCSNCYKSAVENEHSAGKPLRWWQAFMPRFSVQPIKDEDDTDDFQDVDRSHLINEECGKIHHSSVKDVCDVKICTKNLNNCSYLPGHSIAIKTGDENVSSFEFIKEGWNRMWNNIENYPKEIIVGEIIIRPQEETTKDRQGNDRELGIDNEGFEVRPMRICAKPKSLRIFAPTNSSGNIA